MSLRRPERALYRAWPGRALYIGHDLGGGSILGMALEGGSILGMARERALYWA